MNLLKLKLFFVVNLFLSNLSCIRPKSKLSKPLPEYLYIKDIRCKFSEVYIYPNYSCYAKSYSRTISTINTYLVARKPMFDIFLDAILYYKYGNVFHDIMRVRKADYCGFTKAALDNAIVRAFMDVVNESTPGVFHECPYTGYSVRNLTAKMGKILSFFATGEYKLSVKFYFGNGEWIGNYTTVVEGITVHKEPFG